MKFIRSTFCMLLAATCLLATTACTSTKQSNGVTIQKDRTHGIKQTMGKFWPW